MWMCAGMCVHTSTLHESVQITATKEGPEAGGITPERDSAKGHFWEDIYHSQEVPSDKLP